LPKTTVDLVKSHLGSLQAALISLPYYVIITSSQLFMPWPLSTLIYVCYPTSTVLVFLHSWDRCPKFRVLVCINAYDGMAVPVSVNNHTMLYVTDRIIVEFIYLFCIYLFIRLSLPEK